VQLLLHPYQMGMVTYWVRSILSYIPSAF